MRIWLKIRNWVRWHILRKNPLCPKCGEIMVKKGHRGFVQEFKCLKCE